jgi:hypothetical protein
VRFDVGAFVLKDQQEESRETEHERRAIYTEAQLEKMGDRSSLFKYNIYAWQDMEFVETDSLVTCIINEEAARVP